MNIKLICFLFLTAVICSSLAFALEEVAKYEGSLDVGRDGGVVYIGPEVGPAAFCGNNLIDGGEQCDGTNLNAQNCASLLGANYTGALGCKTGCIFDTNGCSLISNNNEGSGNNNQGGGGGGGGGGGSIILSKKTIKNESYNNKSSGCIEDWACSDWNECLAGEQTRNCTDKNNCGTNFLKPALERLCEAKGIFTEKGNSLGALLGAVIGTGKGAIVNIGLIIFFFIAIIAIIIILSATRKKEVPVAGGEVISVGANNKVLNGEKGKNKK